MPYVRNATTNAILASNVVRASGALARVIGFMGRKRIAPSEGLWFDRCWAIHTVGMRVMLDVLFLDRGGRVVEIAVGVPPSRWAVACPRAHSVLELGHGAIAASDVLLGDQIVLNC
ncbi:MAG: hypothetical protein NVSMB31_05170 [Vulcanimicrobiaceae bacterium]